MKIDIHPEIKEACQSVLQNAYHNGGLPKREIAKLDTIIQSFDDTADDQLFSFTIHLTNEGESIIHSIEYDGDTFRIDETHTSYDPEVGSDHFTTYKFFQSPDEQREEGELSSWKSNAFDSLSHIDNDGIELEISIRINEEQQ